MAILAQLPRATASRTLPVLASLRQSGSNEWVGGHPCQWGTKLCSKLVRWAREMEFEGEFERCHNLSCDKVVSDLRCNM